jgi:lipopolysaccharide biosynthesis glycosyltransferase
MLEHENSISRACMSEAMDIVCSFNNDYTQHAAVMMKSLVLNTRGKVRFHCLVSRLSDRNRLLLRKTLPSQSEIIFYEIDSSLFQDFYLGNVTVEAYFRLLIPRLLGNLKKVLYLDVDIVVLGDVSELYHRSLEGRTIAAVTDPGVSLEFVRRLNGKDKYFNSGVMLLDVTKFLEKDVQKCLDFALNSKEFITYYDQCVLNFHFEYLQLLPEHNFMSHFCLPYQELKNGHYTKKEIELAKSRLLVVHFNSYFGKPWQMTCNHPLRYLYWKYLIYTPWKHDLIRIAAGNFCFTAFFFFKKPLKWLKKLSSTLLHGI